MSIEDNVAAGKLASDCFQLVSDLIKESELSPEVKGAAWLRVCEMMYATASRRLPSEEATTTTMGDEEARRFEDGRMPFGKHEGEPLRDVPLSCLAWCDEKNDFSFDLRRYLRRREIWEQQDG